MKKLVILMALALAMSTAALANPVFQDRGAEASNPFNEEKANGGGDCDDTERCIRPGEVKLTVQTWNFSDTDSDGDGLLTLKSTEVIDTNQGQIVSALKSERPKFKAGAELSKTARDNDPTTPKLLCLCSYDYLGIGDLDGDGFGDVMIATDRNEETLTVAGTEISKRDARKGFIKTENSMNKAELIEAMASHTGLRKEETAGVLDAFINTTTKDLDRK